MNNDDIVWFAQVNAKDNKENEIIKIGYKRLIHPKYRYRACWSIDSNDAPALSESIDGLKASIFEKWGNWNTFKWI